ncbi:S1 domain [Dillenia turbinata]|uniref:polyribonucleotide nucleotidyltransferase n=1 Tax=Dillenia turbinata TaxID=194707 RepID=A0AAN8V6C7_9MAGN
MASVATKAKPLLTSLPLYLTWRRFNFRSICSGRLGFAPSASSPSPLPSDQDQQPPSIAGTKILETFKEEFEIGSKLVSLETGKIARFANGAVVLAMDETKVLSTVASAKGDAVKDFLPLTVMANVLSSDGKQDPDIMAANATSAALMLSDIPWNGPIGVIRIGRICGNLSDLNLVYACTKDKTLMIDVQAREISEKDLEAGLRLAHPEFERGEALEQITQDVKRQLEEECAEESLKVLSKVVDTMRKHVIRKRIISEGVRVDGRRLDEVRPLNREAGSMHCDPWSTWGCTTLRVLGPPTKRFMLHYSFPPFCIKEVGQRVGLNRREVGHGTLAEKALLAVLPPEDDFPYTVRVNSEVMASDGSTSMATVCGGVSVGLVSEVDESTGTIIDYHILTDILGLEDHLGDMDFKIVGTRNGVIAIQLDIKPAGIPLDIICESLEPTREGRCLQILDHMEREINAPRSEEDRYSPRLATMKFSNDSLCHLMGPMGALKRKIEEETGARLSVGDGTLTIVAKNRSVMEKVQEKVDFIIGREIEVGGVYKGVVTSIKEYGAFVEFNGGQQGLLHISELSHEPVSRVSELVSIGQQLSLMCIGQDVRGNIKLSLKATSPSPRSKKSNQAVDSASQTKQAPEVWAAVQAASDDLEKEISTSQEVSVSKDDSSKENSSAPSPPVILIRSAAECDEEEKSTGLEPFTKTTGTKLSTSKLKKKSVPSMRGTKSFSDLISSSEDEIAKIYQVHAHGLVLDLGNGLRGMYRFEANGRKDFMVGDELRLWCSSFTSKGIPVMTRSGDD